MKDCLITVRRALNPANSKSKITAYFFSDHEVYSNDLVNILIRNGIKVEQALDDFQITAAEDYRSGRTLKKTFNEGTYIVTTRQPRHLLINTIMARNLAIEDSVMYDMATWSAPLAYNLEAYSTTEQVYGQDQTSESRSYVQWIGDQ